MPKNFCIKVPVRIMSAKIKGRTPSMIRKATPMLRPGALWNPKAGAALIWCSRKKNINPNQPKTLERNKSARLPKKLQVIWEQPLARQVFNHHQRQRTNPDTQASKYQQAQQRIQFPMAII
jgi:hypothetical protein